MVRVALTDAGRELQETAMAPDLENQERLLAPLDGEQRETLARLLQSLLIGFELTDTRWPLQRRTSTAPPPVQG